MNKYFVQRREGVGRWVDEGHVNDPNEWLRLMERQSTSDENATQFRLIEVLAVCRLKDGADDNPGQRT